MRRFGDLPERYCDYRTSRAAILPVPLEATTTYLRGTALGPNAILEASPALEFYDEELDWEPFLAGIHTCQPPDLEGESEARAVGVIEEAASRLVGDGKFVLGLGGEHTVTVGLVRAQLRRHPDLTVVQLDAHADLRETYEGSRFNHACAMRRVLESCPVVHMGVRALDREEMALARERDLPLFLDLDRRRDPSWLSRAVSGIGGPVYISVDLDAMDPAVMPAVGTPEPGGFGWYEILDVLRTLFDGFPVVGADVVELCPRPGLEASSFIAAKLAYKLIGYRFGPRARRV
jgi:agmatinase